MRHGGDLDEATRLHGDPPLGWLDLSTGINPRPYPVDHLREIGASLARLPSPAALAGLLDAARRCYGVPDSAAIVAAPGTEILIRAVARLVSGPAALLRTSYRSYRENWLPGGVREVHEAAELLGKPDESIAVVNPNNPDGRLVDPTLIIAAAESRAPGRLIIVDEAYADSDPDLSIIPLMRPTHPILVLRSFGKFYGLPGLRLGFAVGPQALMTKLSAELGDWPVSGPALAIARPALADRGWRMATRHWLGNQAQATDAVLRGAGLTLAGGCPLFRAAQAGNAEDIHRRLAQQGIWTRIFADWPGLIRFGLPPDGDGLARLSAALSRP